RLVEWVRDGRQPPASAYPRLDAGTLVAIDRLRAPAIPGVRWPRVAHEAYRVDYGPRWREGIITVEPPRLGKAFPVRVPQVDADGNEVAGVRGVELLAPLATYAPWSLRGGIVNADELVDFYGTLIPFPRWRLPRARRRSVTAAATWVHRLVFVIVGAGLVSVVLALLRFGSAGLFTLALAAPVFDERWIAPWYAVPAIEEVGVPVGAATLRADLYRPRNPRAAVLLVHGLSPAGKRHPQ